MKKMAKNLWALLPVAALLMLSACGSDSDVTENVKPEPQNPTGAKQIGFIVRVDNSTRASIGNDQQTLSFATGDQLLITGTNISGLLPMTSGAGSTSAEFSGTLTYTGSGDPASSLALTATLISSENVGVNTSTGEINYGTAICSTLEEAVAKYCLLTGTSTFGTGEATFSLQPQTAFLNFTLTLPDGETAASSKSVTVSGLGTANRTGTVTTEASGNSYVAKFVVPVAVGTPLNAIEVKIGDDATASVINRENNVPTAAAKVYNVTKPLIKWVQLWEDGPYWADRNVGASSVTDYGDYFAWGEVEPKQLNEYSWASYKWMADGISNRYGINKYTFADNQTAASWYNANGEFIGDNKTILDPEDDAAIYNWGSNCRMPTKAELLALRNNNDYEWTMIGNVNGQKFMDKRDHSSYIFLPAAGYLRNGSLYMGGSGGFYWSKLLGEHSDNGADIYFFSGGADLMLGRCNGQSVRPVRDNLNI